MFLIYRPVRLEDLSECLLCTRDHCAFDETSRPQLLAMWRELVVSGAANATLIQDTDRPAGHQFLHFCIIVFVPPDYAARLKASSAAPVACTILNDWLSGHTPWLTETQVRRANSREGVTWVVLHSGPRPEIIRSGEIQYVTTRITDFAPWAIGGYRLNECFLEMYSSLEHTYAEEYGFQLCHEQALEVPGEADVCARLYHLTREEAMRQLGAASAELFHY